MKFCAMMSVPNLTEGAFENILAGRQIDLPIVQILAQKNVSADNVQRFQVALSDGKSSYQFCLMIGPLVGKFAAGEYEKYSIITLKKYVCNAVSGIDKMVIVVTEVEILVSGADIGRVLGNPNPVIVCSKEIVLVEPSSVTKPELNSVEAMLIKEDQICPISQISPYIKNWVIRGRVTNKSAVKSWNNVKGTGKLFSFNLADNSGEIKITTFRAECDKYFEMVSLGNVYILSNATVKEANKKWSDLDHVYELVLNGGSVFKADKENDNRCPQVKFDFVKIGQLESTLPNSVVDIVGVCKDLGELTTITSKNLGKELKKRDISLLDDSEVEIHLTLWNTEAENFIAKIGSVIVAKKARLTDFAGKSLTTTASTALLVNPDLPEVHVLRRWFEISGGKIKSNLLTSKAVDYDSSVGYNHYLDSISKANIISAVNSTLVVNCIATITQIGKGLIYMACPEICKKKLIELPNGFYKCDKCKKEFMQGVHRLIVKFCISDATNSVWVTAFTDEVEKLIGLKAENIAMAVDDDEKKLEELTESLLFKKFQFCIRANLDNYNQEKQTKCNVISVSNVNAAEYSRKLLNQINALI